jgi:hypothetical protein
MPMTTEVENLVLEHLRAIRAEQSRHGALLVEHGVRLTEIAGSVAGMRRDQALDAEASAHLAARVDRLRDEVEQIKRRLELTDS